MNFLRRILRHWPILLLALWFGGMSLLLDHAVALLSGRITPDPADLSAPAPWRHSRLFADPDAYAWLSYARDLRSSPHIRVRWTHMDNAPFGRPVHWAQLPIWSLCGIAAALETFGIPAHDSLELAGRILLPLLGFLAFSSFWLFARHRIPSGLAALFVLSLAVMFFWEFHPLRPDHHGFHLTAAGAFVLPLLFSSFGFAAPTRRTRLPFLVSGFFGGVALWLGATVFFFTLATTTLSALLALLPRRAPSTPPQDSAVWRLWGLAGCAASLFFWLLEYAPQHFSMRLEVNHPLYAISFLGLGELLHLFALIRHDPGTHFSLRFLLHVAVVVTAAAALPTLVLFGPPGWYIPRSPVMLRLHACHISEFLSLRAYCRQCSYPFLRALLVPLLPALAAIPLWHRRLSRRQLFAIPFFVVFLGLYLWQNRWVSFATFASAILFLAFAPHFRPWSATPAPKCRPRYLLYALLVAQLAVALWWQRLTNLPELLRGSRTDSQYLDAFQYRALATQFQAALGAPAVTQTPNADSPVILAPATFVPYLYWYARIPGVASLYWENLPGNADAAEAFADSSPGAPNALAIVNRRRISHLFMGEDPENAIFFDHLHSGIISPSHAATTLAGTLGGLPGSDPLPPWLAVDTELNRLANPPLHIFVPPQGGFVRLSSPIRIYSLMPRPD